MSFDFSAFTELEQARGDQLYICRATPVRTEDYRFGLEASIQIEKTQVPGYAINNQGSEGIALPNGKQRYDASFFAYLNGYAGYDPKILHQPESYLLVNNMGMYEMTLVEQVRWGGIVYYYIYKLDETTDSKALFDKFIQQS